MIEQLIKKAMLIGGYREVFSYVSYLYQFEVFRNVLNLAFSVIEENRLFLKVYNDSPIKTIDGLCETIAARITGNDSNITKNQYVISIRSLTPYVIIHEIAHMIEKDIQIDLNAQFLATVYEDFKNLSSVNILVKNIIDQIIFKEIRLYDSYSTRASELFARYFELFAWCQEVYPKDREYSIHLKELDKIFINTNKWRKEKLDPILTLKTHEHIKAFSKTIPFIDIMNIKHQWSKKIEHKHYKNIKNRLRLEHKDGKISG